MLKTAARIAFLLGTLAFVILVTAHPGEDHELSSSELSRRQASHDEMANQATKCRRELAEFHESRKAKREYAMGKRGTPVDTAITPHYSTIQNFTCITAPEVDEGPYYVNNELYRQNLRDNQAGLPIYLDVGVMDTDTCKPAPNVLVELWSCNPVGTYGGVDAQGTRGQTYSRGGWQTDANGMVEFVTTFPGFYPGRALHIHGMFHQSWATNANGTINSQAGFMRHQGQFFFDETLADRILATSPYNQNRNPRTRNNADFYISQAQANGYKSFVDAKLLTGNLADGVLGYITVGINPRANHPIASKMYYPRKRDTGLGNSYHGDL